MWVAVLAAVLTVGPVAPPERAAAPPASGSAPESKPVVEVNVRVSRARAEVGSAIGITADLKNVSPRPVTIREDEVTLSFPPEVEGGETAGWWALFPSVARDPQHRIAEVTIAPGDTYRTMFRYPPAVPGGGGVMAGWYAQVKRDLRHLFFVPGDYEVFVQGRCSPLVAANEKGPLAQPVFVGSRVLTMGAPQFVIMFGAAVAGALAHLLVRRRGREVPKSPDLWRNALWRTLGWARAIGALGTAAVLAAVVTVLLARISDTQFFVRVSVNDVWGGFAIGFVAVLAGAKVWKRFGVDPGGEQSGQEEKAVAPPAAGAGP